MEYKDICLKVNGKQAAKLKDDSMKFEIYSKQLAVPFRIYSDFETILNGVQTNDNDNNFSYSKKYLWHMLAVLLTKLYVLMIDLQAICSLQGKKCNQKSYWRSS